jgi:hypothetical protein
MNFKFNNFVKLSQEKCLEQINNEIVYLLCNGLLANPCREIVARRIRFAAKQQSQA